MGLVLDCRTHRLEVGGGSFGDGVFLGAGAKVLGPVTVGDGARVGANAVVIHDVPPHATVVGIPARVVRLRTPATSDGAGGAPRFDAMETA